MMRSATPLTGVGDLAGPGNAQDLLGALERLITAAG